MNSPEARHPSRSTPHAARVAPRHPSPVTRHAFTLVEMLVVTAIIAVLAALIFPVGAVVKKQRDLKRTQTQLMMVDSAIRGYNQKLGHYPPDNTSSDAERYQHSALYYELRGTSNNVPSGTFQTLDGSAVIAANSVSNCFAISGFINCTRGAGGDEAQPAIKFLPEVKAGDYVDTTVGGVACRLLGCSVNGPNFVTDTTTGRPFCPWWYNCSSPTNNPSGFDLWVDVQIGSKIYRVGNWSSTYQVLN